MAKGPGLTKPNQKIADWNVCYEQYLSLKRTQPSISQRDYALQLGVDRTYLSTQFAEIRRKRYELDVRQRLPAVLAASLRDVENGLKSNREGNGAEDPKHIQHYALDAFKAIADRAGFSPQAVTLNVTQTNQQAIVLPPIFAGQYEGMADKMLKGANGTPEAND